MSQLQPVRKTHWPVETDPPCSPNSIALSRSWRREPNSPGRLDCPCDQRATRRWCMKRLQKDRDVFPSVDGKVMHSLRSAASGSPFTKLGCACAVSYLRVTCLNQQTKELIMLERCHKNIKKTWSSSFLFSWRWGGGGFTIYLFTNIKCEIRVTHDCSLNTVYKHLAVYFVCHSLFL